MCMPRNISPVIMLLLTTLYHFSCTAVGNDLKTHLTIKKYNQVNESGQDKSESTHEQVYITFRIYIMCVCMNE